MNGEELIKNFGLKFGIDLELDETRACNFTVDDIEVTISLLDELNIIVLTGDLGMPPEFDLERLYKLMLESNYLFNATQGASLALNEVNGHVCLGRYFPVLLLDDDVFYSHVEQFVNVGQFWMQVMKDLSLASDVDHEIDAGTVNSEIMSGFMSV